jgi:hypothetical protein
VAIRILFCLILAAEGKYDPGAGESDLLKAASPLPDAIRASPVRSQKTAKQR